MLHVAVCDKKRKFQATGLDFKAQQVSLAHELKTAGSVAAETLRAPLEHFFWSDNCEQYEGRVADWFEDNKGHILNLSSDRLDEITSSLERLAKVKRSFETAVACRQSIWEKLHSFIRAEQKPDSVLKFAVTHVDSNLDTLRMTDSLLSGFYWPGIVDKGIEIEKTIHMSSEERLLYKYGCGNVYKNRFWKRQPDGIVFDKENRKAYILAFKLSSTGEEEFKSVQEAIAELENKSIVEGLGFANTWTFELITFVAEKSGVVDEEDFFIKLGKVGVAGNSYAKILKAHLGHISDAREDALY